MDSEKKVIINTKTIETQIKKILQSLINEFIVSKEQVTVIDFSANGSENVTNPKEHIEINHDLLMDKISKNYNAFKQIIEKLSNTKINDFKIESKCYTENFSDIITLINSIYDCQFKKVVDNLNIIQPKETFSIINFLKKNQFYLITSIILIIFCVILIKNNYYKK